MLTVEGKANQLVSSKGEVSLKPVMLLLRKYRIVIIDQSDFTLSIITSAFKQ